MSMLIAVGLIMAVSLAGPTAAQTTVSTNGFSARLEQAIDVTKLGSAVPSPAWMRKVRDTLGLPVMVRFYGQVVAVPRDPFLEGLSGNDASDFDRAAVHLGWQYRQLQIARDLGPPDSQRVQEALDRAYRQVVQVRPNPLEGIRRAVSELIASFLHRLVDFAGPGSVLAWSILFGLAAGAVILLRRARLLPERILTTPMSDRPAEEVNWSRRAEEALETGDLVRAVRALYMALLDTLARRGLLAEAPALTAGECRAVVRRARPALYPEVARATELYERVVYGSAPPGQMEVEALLEANAKAGTA
jgi:hypothetical protein